MSKPTILLVNDDSWSAPGITALALALHKTGKYNLRLAAPATEQSGVGHGLSVFGNIDAEPVTLPGELGEIPAFKVHGTPADSLKLGLGILFKDSGIEADLVCSGINRGANVGAGVHASGTCGAAREAAINQIKSIAFSLDVHHSSKGGVDAYGKAAQHALEIIELALSNDIPPDTFVNVNFPRTETYKGYKLTEHGTACYDDSYLEVEPSEPGRRTFKLVGHIKYNQEDSGTDDAWELKQGWVTVSLMQLSHGYVVHQDHQCHPLETWEPAFFGEFSA